MNFGEFIDGKAQQALAPAIAPHEADIHHFYGLCHELCIELLKLFALGLKARNLAMGRVDVRTNGRHRLILLKVVRTSSLLVMTLRKVHLAGFCGFFTYVGLG